MIALIAVLRNAANISSLIDCSEFWMISSVIGSDSKLVTRAPPIGDDEIAVVVDVDAAARMDDGGAALRLDDRRTGEALAGLEQLPVVDVGVVDAACRKVDDALTLARLLDAPVRPRERGGRELADLCERNEMEADELDRRVEAVGVLLLVGPMEGVASSDWDDAVDRALGKEHLHAVLLVLVAAGFRNG